MGYGEGEKEGNSLGPSTILIDDLPRRAPTHDPLLDLVKEFPKAFGENVSYAVRAIEFLSKLPHMVEPDKPQLKKRRWDFVIQESHWLARDFYFERNWKIDIASRLARDARLSVLSKQFSDVRLVCSTLTTAIMSFWLGVLHFDGSQDIPHDLRDLVMDVQVADDSEVNESDFSDLALRYHSSNRMVISEELMSHCCQIVEMAKFQDEQRKGDTRVKDIVDKENRRVKNDQSNFMLDSLLDFEIEDIATMTSRSTSLLQDTVLSEYQLGITLVKLGFPSYVQHLSLHLLNMTLLDAGETSCIFRNDAFVSSPSLHCGKMMESVNGMVDGFLDHLDQPLTALDPLVFEISNEDTIVPENKLVAALNPEYQTFMKEASDYLFLKKVETKVQECGASVHPLVFRPPDVTCDAPVVYGLEAYDQFLNRSVRHAFLSYVYRYGDILAVLGGLRRRQQALKTLKSRRKEDTASATKELWCELFFQYSRESHGDVMFNKRRSQQLSDRKEADNQETVRSDSTVVAPSRKESRSRPLPERRDIQREPEKKRCAELIPDAKTPVATPQGLVGELFNRLSGAYRKPKPFPYTPMVVPLDQLEFGTFEIDDLLGVNQSPKFTCGATASPAVEDAWEPVEDLLLQRLVQMFRYRSCSAPFQLQRQSSTPQGEQSCNQTDDSIIASSYWTINWNLVTSQLNMSLVPLNRARTVEMCRERWREWVDASFHKRIEDMSTKSPSELKLISSNHEEDQDKEILTRLKTYLSTPNAKIDFDVVPSSIPAPRAVLVRGSETNDGSFDRFQFKEAPLKKQDVDRRDCLQRADPGFPFLDDYDKKVLDTFIPEDFVSLYHRKGLPYSERTLYNDIPFHVDGDTSDDDWVLEDASHDEYTVDFDTPLRSLDFPTFCNQLTHPMFPFGYNENPDLCSYDNSNKNASYSPTSSKSTGLSNDAALGGIRRSNTFSNNVVFSPVDTLNTVSPFNVVYSLNDLFAQKGTSSGASSILLERPPQESDNDKGGISDHSYTNNSYINNVTRGWSRPTSVKERLDSEMNSHTLNVLTDVAATYTKCVFDDQHTQYRHRKALVLQWKAELLCRTLSEAAVAHSEVLELRRLGGILVRYGESMKSRSFMNSRAPQLFLGDHHFERHIRTVCENLVSQESEGLAGGMRLFPSTQDASLSELLTAHNISITRDLLPVHKSQLVISQNRKSKYIEVHRQFWRTPTNESTLRICSRIANSSRTANQSSSPSLPNFSHKDFSVDAEAPIDPQPPCDTDVFHRALSNIQSLNSSKCLPLESYWLSSCLPDIFFADTSFLLPMLRLIESLLNQLSMLLCVHKHSVSPSPYVPFTIVHPTFEEVNDKSKRTLTFHWYQLYRAPGLPGLLKFFLMVKKPMLPDVDLRESQLWLCRSCCATPYGPRAMMETSVTTPKPHGRTEENKLTGNKFRTTPSTAAHGWHPQAEADIGPTFNSWHTLMPPHDYANYLGKNLGGVPPASGSEYLRKQDTCPLSSASVQKFVVRPSTPRHGTGARPTAVFRQATPKHSLSPTMSSHCHSAWDTPMNFAKWNDDHGSAWRGGVKHVLSPNTGFTPTRTSQPTMPSHVHFPPRPPDLSFASRAPLPTVTPQHPQFNNFLVSNLPHVGGQLVPNYYMQYPKQDCAEKWVLDSTTDTGAIPVSKNFNNRDFRNSSDADDVSGNHQGMIPMTLPHLMTGKEDISSNSESTAERFSSSAAPANSGRMCLSPGFEMKTLPRDASVASMHPLLQRHLSCSIDPRQPPSVAAPKHASFSNPQQSSTLISQKIHRSSKTTSPQHTQATAVGTLDNVAMQTSTPSIRDQSASPQVGLQSRASSVSPLGLMKNATKNLNPTHPCPRPNWKPLDGLQATNGGPDGAIQSLKTPQSQLMFYPPTYDSTNSTGNHCADNLWVQKPHSGMGMPQIIMIPPSPNERNLPANSGTHPLFNHNGSTMFPTPLPPTRASTVGHISCANNAVSELVPSVLHSTPSCSAHDIPQGVAQPHNKPLFLVRQQPPPSSPLDMKANAATGRSQFAYCQIQAASQNSIRQQQQLASNPIFQQHLQQQLQFQQQRLYQQQLQRQQNSAHMMHMKQSVMRTPQQLHSDILYQQVPQNPLYVSNVFQSQHPQRPPVGFQNLYAPVPQQHLQSPQYLQYQQLQTLMGPGKFGGEESLRHIGRPSVPALNMSALRSSTPHKASMVPPKHNEPLHPIDVVKESSAN